MPASGPRVPAWPPPAGAIALGGAVALPPQLGGSPREAGACRGGGAPDAGEEILRRRPREGESICYAVSVRNTTNHEVLVTGVVADEDRDGAFMPEPVAGAPVRIPARQTGRVEVPGRVRGCRHGGQAVPPAGREPAMRDADGDERTQEPALDVRVEILVEGC